MNPMLKRPILLIILSIIPFISCKEKQTTTENIQNVEREPVEKEIVEVIPGPGDIVEITVNKTYTKEETEESIIPFFENFYHEPMSYGVKSYNIKFISTDFDGSEAVIYAQVFIPDSGVEKEFPVYVFGSGTTGISDECAPSLEIPEERRWGWYKQNMLAYGGSGFITIFPDYLGFNDPTRPQRYFSKLAEGHVMLDSIRAVTNLYKREEFLSLQAKPSGKVFTAGYSQGGHAAFAAADLLRDYAPDVKLTGVIGYASTNNIAALFREGVCYGAEIIYTYMKMYGEDKINPADFLNSRFIPTFEEDATTMCVDVFQYHFSYDSKKLFKEEFYKSLYGKTLAEDYPVLFELMEKNNSGLDGHGIPAFVVQGGTDFIVTNKSQNIFVEALKAKGSDVQYTIYDGIPHKYTRMAGFADSVIWMNSFN